MTLSAKSEDAVTVAYATSDGTATMDEDYTATNGTLTIAAGDLGATVEVPVLDDDDAEDDEIFTLRLSDAEHATIDDGEGQATIADDDGDEPPPALPTLSVDDPEVTEGENATAVFTVTLSAASGDAVTVAYATSDGTATMDEDYTATNGTLTIAAGEVSATVEVPVLDDDDVEESETFDVEESETFTLKLSDAEHATIDDGEGQATIADDDEPPPELPTLSVDDPEVTEGEDATAAFTVTLSATSGDAVTVAYATSDGTATMGEDYASTSGTLTIAAGDLGATVEVPVLDDDDVEENETFTLRLSDAEHATIDDGEGQATIADDDEPPPELPTLSVDDPEVTEAENATAVFTVALSATSGEAVTVAYATSDGTATMGEDYTATNGTLTIAAGEVSATVEVPVLDDDDVEESETFTLTLSDAEHATIDDGEGQATIADDDEPPPELPTLSVDDPEVTEGENAKAAFTVTLSATSGDAVTVAYATSDGTATMDEDYTATNGTLTIAAGEVSATVEVPVLDDDDVEESETFTLKLSDAEHATIDDGEGQATIADDDEPPPELPTLSVDDPEVTEGEDATAVFTVTLSATSGDAVTVAYATSDGTATMGEDYASTSGTLTIAAGEVSATVEVPVLDDDDVEENETFTLRLSDAEHAMIDDGEGQATIADDDEPPPELPTLSVDDPEVTEARGRDCRVHGDAERDQRGSRDGGVRDVGRHGDHGRGLHRHERDADDSRGRGQRDGRSAGSRRRRRGGERDLHAQAVRRRTRDDRRRRGPGDHRGRRRAAARTSDAVRRRS